MKSNEELRPIVEAATPGPWFYRKDEEDHAAAVAHEHGWVEAILPSGEQENNDARFCATFNPAKVKAMLDQIDAQQEKIDALMLEYCPDEMTHEQIDEWEKHQKVSDFQP
jgi:hypothetical protein